MFPNFVKYLFWDSIHEQGIFRPLDSLIEKKFDTEHDHQNA